MKVIAVNPEHDQRSMSLKYVDVDIEMVDINKWFNSFTEVYTMASCQGFVEEHGEEGQKPYVMWMSLDPLETQRVLERFRHKEKTTVRYDHRRNMLTYITTWPSLDYLKKTLPYYKNG